MVVDGLLVNLLSSRIGGRDVGRNLTDELEGGLEVVVVLANVEVDLCVVVVVVRFELVGVTRNCGEIVGTNGGREVLFLMLSSIKSVSMNPLKFCFARSFCKFITVIALPSSSSGSLLTPSSDGMSENGMMLLSSCSSSRGIELGGDENFGPRPPVNSSCSSCSTAFTCALRISRSNCSLLLALNASTTAAKSKSSVSILSSKFAMLVVDCTALGLTVLSTIEFPVSLFREGTVGIKLIKFLLVDLIGGSSVVNGRNFLLGGPEVEKRVAGRRRRPGLLSGRSLTSTSSLSSRSVAVNGNRFDCGLVLVFPVARGRSLNSSTSFFFSLTGTLFIGCLALFPVGTMRTRFRFPLLVDPRPLPDADDPLPLGFENEPLEGSAFCCSSSSPSGTAPLTACDGPGKSSGTIGLPLTRDIIGGGVGDSLEDPRINSCIVFNLGVDGEDEITSFDGLRSREAVGVLGGNSLTGTLAGARPGGVGVVGRDLTLDTGRLGACVSDDPIDPTVVDNGLRRTLAPLIKSC